MAKLITKEAKEVNQLLSGNNSELFAIRIPKSLNLRIKNLNKRTNIHDTMRFTIASAIVHLENNKPFDISSIKKEKIKKDITKLMNLHTDIIDKLKEQKRMIETEYVS